MGTEKLSHILLDMGFFSALGTTEWAAGEKKLVLRGTPKTWDANNGVIVVYDDDGRPWISANLEVGIVTLAVDKYRVGQFNLQRGAYVPHSNDGGQFIHYLLPAL